MTSRSCSGTCLTFSIPRQPKVRAADAALARGGRGVDDSALRSAASSAAGVGRARVVGSVLMLPAPRVGDRFLGGLVLGRAAGQRKEHLVEARLADREVGDPDACSRQLGEGLGGPVGIGARHRQRRGVGLELNRAELVREDPLGLGSLLGIEQAHVQRARPDRGLELAGRALGDHPAVVDHGDPVGELVRLVEVLRAEQDRGPLGDERADDVPDLVAGARVEPGRRLVEEHHLRRDHEARGDVEPPPHAPGVVLDQPAGRLGEAESLQQLGRPRLGLRPASSPAAGRAGSGSRGPVRSSSTEASCPVRLTRPRTASASSTMSCPSTRAEPASGRSSVASIRIVVVLPAPFGPEHAVHGAAAHGQVDAVDRLGLAERLHEAGGLDGERGLGSGEGIHQGSITRSRLALKFSISWICRGDVRKTGDRVETHRGPARILQSGSSGTDSP